MDDTKPYSVTKLQVILTVYSPILSHLYNEELLQGIKISNLWLEILP